MKKEQKVNKIDDCKFMMCKKRMTMMILRQGSNMGDQEATSLGEINKFQTKKRVQIQIKKQ